MYGKHFAVDLGSSSGKMLLGEIVDGRKVELREVGTFQTPRIWYNDHLCTNVYGVLENIGSTLRQLGKEGVRIASFGADSWSSDFGLVDPAGELVGLPVFYRDWRTYGMPEEVEKVISYEALYGLSTQRRMQDSTLCQLLAIKKEKPSLLENGNRMLFLGDLLMYFFSGRVCSELSLASYSQLFSMKNMCWENKVFDLFGLSHTLQPEVVSSCACLGSVSRRTAEQYGIERFEIVAPAAHDTSSAVAAIPVEDGRNWAFISTGSWFLVGMELEAPVGLPLCYRYNFSNTGAAFGKTMLKRNVTAMWILQECMRSWKSRGVAESYAQIQALAEQARPFAGMLDTDSIEFYSPEDMPEAICAYLKRTGQGNFAPDDVGTITRMVDEAIAFKCAYAIACMEKITGKPIEVIYVVGGASAVSLLNAMIADATNREVVTPPREATSIGNCLLQAFGCGELSSEEELRAIVRNSIPPKRYFPREHVEWARRQVGFEQHCGMKE